MGNKLVITIRFHTEGDEEELYRRIQAEKVQVGLSASEYVKKILSDYFEDMEKRSEAENVLQAAREEYREMVGRVEGTIRRSIQEHDALLLGALGRISGAAIVPEGIGCASQEYAGLPEEGEDIPEGTLDFLDNL